MRYGIISDIHGNLEALDAVVAGLSKEKVDKVICLGDIVGYGADPMECYEKVKEMSWHCVAGNHDLAAVGTVRTDNFNLFARIAVMWTRNQLSDEAVEYMRTRDLVKLIDGFQIVHSNLYEPEQFEYIQTSNDAANSFENQITDLCFAGHSHIPVALIQKSDTIMFTLDSEIDIVKGQKILINVGSVGQPRDENPKASYVVYDSQKNKVWVKRVDYNIQKAISKILNAGLPEILGERLRYGR